jgi:uncharacterized protein DUF4388
VLSGSRVTAALERLAERRVSGILEMEGNPAGTIYLNQGQITFARASWIPDLGARLPGALRPSAAAPDLIADPDRPDRDIGSVLVQRKYLSRDELRAILCSVIMDAALVLMAPADRDAFVSDVRFAAPGTHWAGAFSSLCVDVVLAEASKIAERVGRYNLARTTPVQLCDLSGPPAVLTREQWAVACAIDGSRSVQDLAWQCGLALYDAIERVGGLVQAGVCAPCDPAETTGSLARWFGHDAPGPATLPVLSPPEVLAPMPVRGANPVRSHVSAQPPAPVLSPTAVLPPPSSVSRLPHRAPGGPRAARTVMSAPVWINGPEMTGTAPPGDFAAAQPDLLRRVLDGLRKLG